jgi:hypothetical protein
MSIESSNSSGNSSSNSSDSSSKLLPNGARRERQRRNLILDYALGICILGLIPIPRLFTLKLLLAFGLNLKMIWDIKKLWKGAKGQDFLAIAGVFFGCLGAFAMAFTAWMTFFGLSVFMPYLKGLAFCAALFTVSWGVGQSVNQFYASGDGDEA